MTPKQMKQCLSALLDTDVPTWVWGPPGTGKSQILQQVAAEKGLGFIDLRLTTMDPVDLRGLPVVKKGLSEWARPSFLPSAGRGVIALEEVAQANTSMQAAAMQLVLDRRVGDHVLCPGWRIVALSNRQEDRAGAGRVITPLLNRFTHLEMEVGFDDWREWAEAEGVDHRVLSYLKYRPDMLFRFSPEATERGFATPRSWGTASRILKSDVPWALMGPTLCGTVGEGPGTEIMAFLSIYDRLPDLDLVWAKPTTAPVPKEASACWAMGGVLCEGVRGDKGTKARLEAFGVYCSRFPSEELAVAVITDGFRANGELKNAPSVCKFLRSKLDLIASASPPPAAPGAR